MAKHSNNFALKVLFGLFITFFLIVSGYEYFQYGSIFNNSEHYRKIYAEALNLKNNEEYSQAFSKLDNISPRYEAYEAVLYQQAQCAAKTGDEASVQKKLKALISKYPQGYLYIPAKYDLAKSYLRSGNNDVAQDTFQNIINNHKSTNYEIGSYYYLAEINAKKHPEMAIKYWKQYIKESQDGRFSKDCVTNIINSKTNLSNTDKFYIGLIFFNSQNFDEALKYLQESQNSKAWFYIAKIYSNRNNPAKAKEFIKTGLTNYASGFSQDDIAEIMYLYANISSSKLQAWSELANIGQNKQNIEDVAIFNKAAFLPEQEAQVLYKKIVNNHLKGDYASEALKKLFWIEYNNKNFEQARAYADKHVNNFSDTKSAPQMHYWLGKISEKNNKDFAIKIYNKILSKYPDDYYAFRAFTRVSLLEKGEKYGWEFNPKGTINQEDFSLELPYTYSEIKTKFGATVAELLMVEDYYTIDYFEGFDEPFIESWIAYKKGLRSTATTTARNAMDEFSEKPNRNDKKWKFVYPCYFMSEINKYAQRNKISPYLLISIIREESYFNPLALSQSGAVGLTQILPSTAKEVSERRGYGRINEFLLFNPETNIKYGAAYISQLKKQLDNQNVYTVAAYNGGAGSVKKWQKDKNYSDFDEFIENIPYPETQNYVKKVFRSYWNYVRIYAE